MKYGLIVIAIFLLATHDLWAVCSSPISRTNNSPSTPLTSTKYNADLNTVYTKVNSLPGDCINDASITASKIADGSITSAKLASTVLANVIPAGMIMAYGAAAAPTGFLLCNGTAVSRATYAALFAIIGTNFGSGDGSTTFNVPDFRGRFLRGVDGGAGRDPNRATRTVMNTGGSTGDNVGSVQLDALQNMTGNVGGLSNLGGTFSGVFATGSSYSGNGQNSQLNYSASFDASRVARTSTETRPTNANVNYIIKF